MPQIKRFVFTYSQLEGHLWPSEDELKTALGKISKEGVFQLERGAEGRLHYQGRLELLKRSSASSLNFDICENLGLTGNDASLTVRRENEKNSETYCMKKETREPGHQPVRFGISYYTEPHVESKIPQVPWCYDLEQLRKSKYSELLRERKIICIHDSRGGSGKTTYIRYLCTRKDANYKLLPLDRNDRTLAATACFLRNEEIDGFVMNFPRTKGMATDMDAVFQTIEDIKDGHFTAQFYGKPDQVICKKPFIILFMNEDPSEYLSKLSRDRWMVFTIAQLNLYHYDVDYRGAGEQFDLGETEQKLLEDSLSYQAYEKSQWADFCNEKGIDPDV